MPRDDTSSPERPGKMINGRKEQLSKMKNGPGKLTSRCLFLRKLVLK